MGKRLPRWRVRIEVNPEEFVIKGHDEADAWERFWNAIRRRPAVVLDRVVEVTVVPAGPDAADDL